MTRVTGMELALARHALGLTQKEVAEKLGVSTRTIMRREQAGYYISDRWPTEFEAVMAAKIRASRDAAIDASRDTRIRMSRDSSLVNVTPKRSRK